MISATYKIATHNGKRTSGADFVHIYTPFCSQKDSLRLNRLATNNGNGSFGAAIEGKGTLNICTGTLSADLTLVFSIGTKGVISIFGYNYEYDLSYDYAYTSDPIKWQSDSLKLIASR